MPAAPVPGETAATMEPPVLLPDDDGALAYRPPRGSLIGSDIEIIGNVTSPGGIAVAGLIRGSVTADTVVVLEGGRIEGPVEARLVYASGTIAGRITAHELHLRATSFYRGEITTEILSIAFGADFEADVHHTAVAAQPPT